MSTVEEFAKLVESFMAGKPNTFAQNNLCETPSETSLEAFLLPGATLTPVRSIKCLSATFEALVVDYGLDSSASSRFVALVLKKSKWKNQPQTVVFNFPCRSQSRAKTEAESACREFAASQPE